MKLTGVPLPYPKGPRGGRIGTIKEIRKHCGLSLQDAKEIYDRVGRGEKVNLPLLRRPALREVMNAFLGAGCSVHPEGDPPTREQIAEVNEEALFADGLEDALIGYVSRYGQPPLALYDRDKCIEIFMRDANCHADVPCAEGEECEECYLDAVEHFDFNVIGAWMGENTPAYATLLRKEDV
jgi:hypothetical protein